MVSHAKYQLVRHEASNVEDVLVDKLSVFAGAACVKGRGLSQTRAGLRAQLGGIPPDIVDEILTSALIEEFSVINSYQNSSIGVASDGKSHSFKVFYATSFREPDVYHSCVTAKRGIADCC
jgi:hypothetical protein